MLIFPNYILIKHCIFHNAKKKKKKERKKRNCLFILGHSPEC